MPVAAVETTAYNGEVEEYIACYPYESNEIGDLVFSAGERISVFKKEGDWWTGSIGTRTGIFPSNYVQPISDISYTDNNHNAATDSYNTTNASQDNNINAATAIPPMSEEAQRQEEADTEVSEINTQSKTENVQEIYSRPMSTSTTPVNRYFIFGFHAFKITVFVCVGSSKGKR